MKTKKDYYKVLEVNRNADEQTITKSYRRLAKKYYPDVNKDPDAEEKFKELSEAYAVLSDDKKRRLYDSYGFSAFTNYTREDLIKTINLKNLYKGVKFAAQLEKDYGLISMLVGIGIGGKRRRWKAGKRVGMTLLSAIVSRRFLSRK